MLHQCISWKTNICVISSRYFLFWWRNHNLSKHNKILTQNSAIMWTSLPCSWLLSLISDPEPTSSSLYNQPASQYRKRESTVSETTTTTLVGGSNVNNGSAKMSNGGGSTLRATSVSPLLISENAVWKVCHIPTPYRHIVLLCDEAAGVLEPAGCP
jgi:hypothetical protein